MYALHDVVYEERPAGSLDERLEPPAPIIDPTRSLIAIAQTFVGSETIIPTLVVMENEEIVGLVSRIDLVRGILQWVAPEADHEAQTLYISALKESAEKPSL